METLKCAGCGMELTGQGDVKCSMCKLPMTCTEKECSCTACGNLIEPKDAKCDTCLAPKTT